MAFGFSSRTSSKEPNYGGLNPRMAAAAAGRAQKPRYLSYIGMLLPLSLVFTLGGIAYVLKWDADRQSEGPCVDCKRQREIMEEVYSNKRQRVQTGYRL